MTLKFKSNKSVAKPGFKATITGKQNMKNLLNASYILLSMLSHFIPQQLGREDDNPKNTWKSFDDVRNMEPYVYYILYNTVQQSNDWLRIKGLDLRELRIKGFHFLRHWWVLTSYIAYLLGVVWSVLKLLPNSFGFEVSFSGLLYCCFDCYTSALPCDPSRHHLATAEDSSLNPKSKIAHFSFPFIICQNHFV